MEKWRKAFCGQIPKGSYETELLNGEEKGLVVKLFDSNTEVSLSFGYVRAVRMLDEGLVQKLYYGEEFEQFRREQFSNVIYELEDGEFVRQVKKMAGGMWSVLVNPTHYMVVTQNYNIEIIAEGEPELKVHHIY